MTTLVTDFSAGVQTAGDRRAARLLDAARAANTPALLIDPITIGDNYQRIRAAFPQAHIFYAVKANPHPSVIGTLSTLGCGMDVASGAEVDLALAHRAPARNICFSAPFKRGKEIAAAFRQGIDLFVADSSGEVENIARHAPGARLLVRLAVSGGHALTPMGKKFGANPEDVVPLFRLATDLGLVPYGMHFHVGSQCLEQLAWSHAIGECAPVWHAAREEGMDLQLMDIGGGFPVRYESDVPAIEEIAGPTLAAARVWLGPDVQLALEPGRWMTNDAAVMVTEVIGMATRGQDEWVYLDAGLYNGMIDAGEGVLYPMYTPDELATGDARARRRVTLAGPSCDGNDVLMRGIWAPELAIGDRLLFFQAGAYTTAFERFNGLAYPGVV
ncbi:MAG TPA: type III PLP-dependent enzyme, partial [Chloroflexota bacterium]|nr:type III PLP-dependent enzyme [Chloroflexota bacterium]